MYLQVSSTCEDHSCVIFACKGRCLLGLSIISKQEVRSKGDIADLHKIQFWVAEPRTCTYALSVYMDTQRLGSPLKWYISSSRSQIIIIRGIDSALELYLGYLGPLIAMLLSFILQA